MDPEPTPDPPEGDPPEELPGYTATERATAAVLLGLAIGIVFISADVLLNGRLSRILGAPA